MKPKGFEFLLAADPGVVRSTTEEILLRRNFRFNWMNEWTCVVERGSKLAYYLLRAKYVRIGVRIFSPQPEELVLQIDLQSRHASLPLTVDRIANAEMTDELNAIRGALEEAFTQAGTLRGVREV